MRNSSRDTYVGNALWAIFCALVFLVAPVRCLAGVTTFTPRLQLTGKYDNNVWFTKNAEKDDFLGIVTPELDLGYKTETMDLRALGVASIKQYRDETNLNATDATAAGQGLFKVSEKLRLIGDLRYKKQSKLETDLDNPDFPYLMTDENRFRAMGKVSYAGWERTELAASYLFQQANYEFEGNVDWHASAFRGAFTHTLKNRKDILSFQPGFTRYDSDDSSTNDYAAYLGWTHKFSDIYESQIAFGARYTDVNYTFFQRELVYQTSFNTAPIAVYWHQSMKKDSGAGLVADIYLARKDEDYTWTLGAYRRLGYNAYGEPVETTAVYGRTEKDLSERFRAILELKYYWADSLGSSYRQDSRHFDAVPSLVYRLTGDSFLLLGYKYTLHDEASPAWDGTYDRQQVWLTFSTSFPRQW